MACLGILFGCFAGGSFPYASHRFFACIIGSLIRALFVIGNKVALSFLDNCMAFHFQAQFVAVNAIWVFFVPFSTRLERSSVWRFIHGPLVGGMRNDVHKDARSQRTGVIRTNCFARYALMASEVINLPRGTCRIIWS